MNKEKLWFNIIGLILFYSIRGEAVHEPAIKEEIEGPLGKSIPMDGGVTIKKGGKDKYEYKHFVLENGADVVLVREDDLAKSAVAISVGVGGLEDPLGSEGMAHFVEHMLFMGSEKYPEEDGYKKYISRKGGINNGGTMSDTTIFYHSVLSEGFEESLDMLSGFFTSPLMNKDSVEREVKAVHSEHLKDIPSEHWRFLHLTTKLRKKGSPLGRYWGGCKDTLFGDDLRERAYDFWKRKYSAEKFCIVLGGSQSFDVLEGYARKYFKDLPVREEEKKEDDGIGYFHYDEKYTGKLIRIKPAVAIPGSKSPDVLKIIITIPETTTTYKKKIDLYICTLLGIQRNGGFVDTLRLNEYVGDMSVGPRRNMKMNTEIEVTMSLLPKGKKRISEIKKLLKEYLSIMRKNTCEGTFNLVKKAYGDALQKLRGDSILDQVNLIAKNSQTLPMEDVLVGEYIYEDYDDEEINRVLDIMLDDSKWIHIYLTTEGPFDITGDKYFGIEYGITEYEEFNEDDEEYRNILESMRWSLGAFEEIVKHKFETLKENAEEYIKKQEKNGEIIVGSSRMKVLKLDEINEKQFSCGLKDAYGELRYLANKDFKTEKTVLWIVVETGENMDKIDKVTKCHVHFTGFYMDLINKYKNEIREFGNDFKSVMAGSGNELVFLASGAHPGVYGFAELFFREYKNSGLKCKEEFFDAAKSKVEDMYASNFKDVPPFKALGPAAFKRLSGVGFQAKELLESTQKIKITDELVKIEKGYIRFMLSGNGMFSDGVELYGKIRKYIKEEGIMKRKVYPIDDDGNIILGGKSADINEVIYVEIEDENNNAVGVFHDIGPGTEIEVISMSFLVRTLLESRFFSQLRTKECLGYVISMETGFLGNGYMIRYIVQGEEKAENIQERIEAFIKESYKIVEDMTEKEYSDYVNSAGELFKVSLKNVDSYSAKVLLSWLESGEFNLRMGDNISAMIRKTKKEDVVKFLQKDHKKIVVHAIHNSKRTC